MSTDFKCSCGGIKNPTRMRCRECEYDEIFKEDFEKWINRDQVPYEIDDEAFDDFVTLMED
jgi:hypothetical protein